MFLPITCVKDVGPNDFPQLLLLFLPHVDHQAPVVISQDHHDVRVIGWVGLLKSYVIFIVGAKQQMITTTDNGHPERAFFFKFETFGLGQTNWAEILGGILAISSQTIGTILAL